MSRLMELTLYDMETQALQEGELLQLEILAERRPHRLQFLDVLRRTSSDALRKWLDVLKSEETLGSEVPGPYEIAAARYHIELIAEVMTERDRQ